MKLEKAEVIWFNGELVPWEEARVHVLTHALHYASSVFEGVRVYATPSGPAALELRSHAKRLLGSCRIVELPLERTAEEIERAILDTVRRNRHDSCYVRPVVFRGYGEMGVDPSGCPVEMIVATWPLGTHFGPQATSDGITACVSSWRRMAPDTLPAMAKSAANYLNSQLIVLEARRRGCDDGLALDSDGYASEASGANLFVVCDGGLITPPAWAGILPGITRKCVLALGHDLGIDVREQRIPREQLYVADEVFLTGTAAEITPVRSIDGRAVGDGRAGPITRRLQGEFFGLVRGELPDRHGWLTPVGRG
ncbi:MAG TPA: branched-chain amino acid transaminase [Planctomycetota bacterium]|nr:branched-chain amino acid transaminase [Planctomycetota bacterium]